MPFGFLSRSDSLSAIALGVVDGCPSHWLWSSCRGITWLACHLLPSRELTFSLLANAKSESDRTADFVVQKIRLRILCAQNPERVPRPPGKRCFPSWGGIEIPVVLCHEFWTVWSIDFRAHPPLPRCSVRFPDWEVDGCGHPAVGSPGWPAIYFRVGSSCFPSCQC